MSDALDADGHFKRIACQVYTQLPENKREALLVLRYVRQIVFCLGEEWGAASRSSANLSFAPCQKDQAEGPAFLKVVPNDRPDRASPE